MPNRCAKCRIAFQNLCWIAKYGIEPNGAIINLIPFIFFVRANEVKPKTPLLRSDIRFRENARSSLASTLAQSYQRHDFSIIGESVSLHLLFRKNYRAIALHIEDSPGAFYQAGCRIGISFLHFRFHPGSLREEVSTDAVSDRDVHTSSFSDSVAGS